MDQLDKIARLLDALLEKVTGEHCHFVLIVQQGTEVNTLSCQEPEVTADILDKVAAGLREAKQQSYMQLQ